MAAKATPFATFCAIIPGAFVPARDGAEPGRVTFTSDPRVKRSFVRINKFLYGLLFHHLKTRPAVRLALVVEPNPTLRKESGRVVYLTATDGREVFQRLADNEVLELIASRFLDGGGPTLGDLVRALSLDPEIDATAEEAEAYLNKLLEIGYLRFHMGIREQDADWDLPFRALLDRIGDDHARQTSELLCTLRERMDEYSREDVDGRSRLIDDIHTLIERALDSMKIAGRLRRDMPFYEDATSAASAEIPLEAGVRRVFGTFEEWVRLTARLAWPRAEQATMRHFYQHFYGDCDAVPLLAFYEDFYREHFKAHVEKEQKARNGANREALEGYDVGNPFGLEVIRTLTAVRARMGDLIRDRWIEVGDAEAIDLTAHQVGEALQGVETLSGVPRSMGAFGILVPPADEGADPAFLLHNGSYTAGYGKYFSRFLYMLPDGLQEEVRTTNAALTGEMLAEICGDAHFNANLHPPLMRWEISYPTGESGATESQLRSSEIVVQPDPEDPHALRLVHGPTGRRVIPVDLGFLNPRMRPPLYQLLSRFTPPVMFAPSIPESLPSPPPVEGDAPAPRPPSIGHRPRVTYGGGSLILARRRWTVPAALLPQRRPDESAAEFFVRVNRWRAEAGLPETAYLRIYPLLEPREHKPGQRAPAQDHPQAEAAQEIPGYEAAVEDAQPHDEEHEPEIAADGEPRAGAPAWDAAAGDAKKRTQPSRDFFKPQFIDFANPLLVSLLGRIGAGLKSFTAAFEERLPDRGGLARHGADSYVTELVVQLYFPGGIASEHAGAGEIAIEQPA